MSYDLDAIEADCRSYGLSCDRISLDELRVRFGEDCELCIANTESGADTYLGFSDGSWHTHGDAVFMTGADTYVELSPLQVIDGLRTGVLLIGSRYFQGELKDRWIFHRSEKQDFQYFEPEESVVIVSLGKIQT